MFVEHKRGDLGSKCFISGPQINSLFIYILFFALRQLNQRSTLVAFSSQWIQEGPGGK